MPDMTPAELQTFAVTDPEAATAMATISMAEFTSALANSTAAMAVSTASLVDVTIALVAASLFVGLLQVGVVWRGIDKMVEAGE
ncbi:MAG: hypothetical protein OXE57_10565, partial [Alphaproteobacteria bacterium]|nr:hypothetical protein [Alphaproteobacteria bacterium]